MNTIIIEIITRFATHEISGVKIVSDMSLNESDALKVTEILSSCFDIGFFLTNIRKTSLVLLPTTRLKDEPVEDFCTLLQVIHHKITKDLPGIVLDDIAITLEQATQKEMIEHAAEIFIQKTAELAFQLERTPLEGDDAGFFKKCTRQARRYQKEIRG